MGRDGEPVGFGQGANLDGIGDAADVDQVRLEDVRASGSGQIAELGDGGHAFAGGNGHVGDGCDVGQPAVVFGAHGLFVKEGPGELEFPGQAARHGNIGAAVKIEGDVDVRPDGVAHRPGARHGGLDSAVGVDGGQWGAGVHLDGPRAFSHHACGLFGRGGGGVVVSAGPAVDLHAVANAASEQLVHGEPGGFAGEVPEGDLNAAQGAHVVRTAMIEAAVVAAAHETFDPACILMQEVLAQFVHSRFGRSQLPFDGELAKTLQPVARQYPQQAPARSHLGGFDAFDDHGAPHFTGFEGVQWGRMKFLAALLLSSLAFAQEPLKISVFVTAGGVMNYLSKDEMRAKAEKAFARLGVTRIFLEGRRGDEYVTPEVLTRLRDYFRARGIETTGAIATVPGKTFGVRQNEGYGWLNFEDPMTRAGITRFFEENAAIFDEIIIDDFYCTGDTSELSQKARGGRDWPEYRREMLTGLIEPMIWSPARRVNPRVKLIMKFPQWYDLFDRYGYEPARMGAAFPQLWAGTEVRNPKTARMGFVQPTEGYVNWSWLKAVNGEKLHGAWFDHIESTAQNVVDQAFQSVLAGARELTLFHMGDLMEWHPGDALLVEKMPELKDLARKVKGLERGGVPFYKPVNSVAGENRFLADYLAMNGVPIKMVATYPSESRVVFLGQQAAHDPQLDGKIAAHLKRGATVAVTPALLRARPRLARQAGVTVPAQPQPGTAAALTLGDRDLALSRPLELEGGLKAAAAKVLVSGGAVPVLTAREAGGGRLMVYNLRTFNDEEYAQAKELLLPPLERGLAELPRAAADALRAPLVEPLGMKFSAPSGVGLYLFGKSAVLYNFLPEGQDCMVGAARHRVAANGWTWID